MALRILIFGAPGCGKGTISKFVASDFGFVHIAAGDLIRSKIHSGEDAYKELKELVDRGQLIPDTKVTQIVRDEVNKFDNAKRSILLDGFPRNITQTKLLDSFFKTDLVINIEVPFPVIIQRLCDRMIHEASGRIYNLKWNPPKKPGIDDITGEPLIRRQDDDADVVKRRLVLYEESLQPVLEHFRRKGLLKSFRGEESKEIYKVLKPFMENFVKEHIN
ncbi:GTP:AMP phosphotransferase AK3, mitochondrial [Thelohanellus kitauei]|uniref:GTP:AMP phosphotransferase AK3, mitochondrial n=1 Tax=Thelohanellus kitauei TaxID=669202 RepID=A0A0C2NFP4_THEKT|nr:GTP:AMP phosphotransferase AK3, mitochondrial [Thelohanellus kitauei]